MTHSHGNLLGEPPATLLPARPRACSARRKPWFGGCDHGTGPKPFQPARRSASSPRW